jgi:bacteriorhodopsin
MDYSDWLWIKFCVIVGAAFVYGIWRGFTGRPL